MSIELIPVTGIPEVKAGDVLAELIAGAAEIRHGDVVVVTQKIVSKAEDRMVAVDPDEQRVVRGHEPPAPWPHQPPWRLPRPPRHPSTPPADCQRLPPTPARLPS